jgi:lipopolysaccharide export LptBFGC system permease protein LptF
VVVSFAAGRLFGLAGAAAGSVTAIYFEHFVTLRRISKCTGIPLRRVQDWRSLALLLLCAALAGLVAWCGMRFLDVRGSAARATAGGVLLGAAYLGLITLFGLGRDWRSALQGLWRRQ